MVNEENLNKFIELMNKYEKIALYSHGNPDGDALGSVFGLRELLQKNFPKKEIYAFGKEYTSGNLNKIFPEFNKIEEMQLNQTEKFLAIVLDTTNENRVSINHYLKAEKIVKIDHHIQNNSTFGDLSIVDEISSSTCEIILDIAEHFVNIIFTKKAYKYLLTGIVTDTDRFRFPSTTSKTMKYVQNLYNEVKFDDLYEKIYSKSLKDFKISSKIILNSKFKDGVMIYVMPRWYSKKLNYKNGAKKIFLNDLLIPSEVEIGLFLSYDFNKKIWKGSLRSKKIAINELAEKYGGGGHKLASGFSVNSKNDIKAIKKDLLKLINESKTLDRK